jgi:hypothetical protein
MTSSGLGFGPDPPQEAEDGLDEERWRQKLSVEEMSQSIEMADIVAFEFEPRSICLADLDDDAFDLLEGIRNDATTRRLQIGLLPFMLP